MPLHGGWEVWRQKSYSGSIHEIAQASHGTMQVTIRFYAELNDFLPEGKRGRPMRIPLRGRVTVKDVIERCGIPHTEVDLITVDGTSRDFSYIVKPHDRVNVYPVFESLDITPLLRVRPEPLRYPKFILDVHLGTLARYLRLIGYDTAFQTDIDDAELAGRSATGHRILLTRDRGLLKRNTVTHGYCIRNDDPLKQIREVIHRFDLKSGAKPFTRCLECNGILHGVDRETIRDLIPPKVYAYHHTFVRCDSCGKIFWPGTHYRHLRKHIEEWVE